MFDFDTIMSFLTGPEMVAFGQVILIDLVLAGDNAIVVGMAAAGLPAHQRAKVILIGIAAATVMRIGFALATTYLLTIVGLTTFLLSKKLTLETHRRDGLLLDMIANISGHLDRLDSGFDGIAAQTGIARNRLLRLVALHRENLLVCAILGEKQRQMRTSSKKPKRRRRFVMSYHDVDHDRP